MFKSLATIGSIVGFIACAFVPPTDANFATAAQIVIAKGVDTQGMTKAANSVQRIIQPTTFLSRAATSVHSVRTHSFTSAWKTTKNTGTDQLVDQLERIEWASRKSDVRLCGEVMGDPDVTVGDYRALCVAIVTGDSARCEHLRALQHVCANELLRT